MKLTIKKFLATIFVILKVSRSLQTVLYASCLVANAAARATHSVLVPKENKIIILIIITCFFISEWPQDLKCVSPQWRLIFNFSKTGN